MTTHLASALSRLRPVEFSALPGWGDADISGFWSVFRAGAQALVAGLPPLRQAVSPSGSLFHLARAALTYPDQLSAERTRAFLERHTEPYALDEAGFLTGYYEPLVDGSWLPSWDFSAPILPRPGDLVTLAADERPAGLPEDHSAARRRSDGGLEVYADRAAMEDYAIGPGARPLVWLRDWTEVFLVQVQGSARVRLPDGTEHRLVYAGRNGHPYTSIGRLLTESGEIPAEAMSLDRLKSWLRENGQGVGERGRDLMQKNRSYIFFRMDPADSAAGPIGGAGLPLAPSRSIAVDRSIWPYGLPFWIESVAPLSGFGPAPLRRLFVAQDTGSAILGPARADLFVGSGTAAGRDAGSIRHAARFTVLLPRPS